MHSILQHYLKTIGAFGVCPLTQLNRGCGELWEVVGGILVVVVVCCGGGEVSLQEQAIEFTVVISNV